MSASASSSTHATRAGGVRFAQLRRNRRPTTGRVICGDQVARRSADRRPCRPDRSRPRTGAGCARLQQRRAPSSAPPWCAPSRRSPVSVSVDGFASAIDRGDGGIGVLAAQRHAFDLGGVGQALERDQPRAGFRRVTRDAAERLLVAHARRSPRGAPSSGPAALRHLRQLALAAERRQRGHGGHRHARRRASTPARPAGRARDRARCLRTRCGRCRRAPTASPIRATATRRTRASVSSLANAFSDSMIGGIELVNRFDADVGVGVRGLGLRAELVENSHWCFRPRPAH